MWYLFYLYNFILAFIISLILTRLAIFISCKYHIYDSPGDRKLHTSDMPRAGWIGLFGGVLLTVFINSVLLMLMYGKPCLVGIAGEQICQYIPGFYKRFPQLFGLLSGGLFITLLGLIDDRFGLSPLQKLSGQVLAALVLVFFDIRVTLFIDNYYLSVILTVVWVVAVINAFNLLDNMDGLSGGVALIASLLFFFAVSTLKQFFVSSILSVLAGAVLGFLVYNFKPSRIFMGDAGSMFLGYMVAALTVSATFHTGEARTYLSVIMPLIILAVPIYDTLSVIIIRLKNRRPVYTGDNSHFSHRLVNLGMTERGAVMFIYLVTFCAGLPALFLPFIGIGGAVIALLQTIGILCVVAFLEYYGKSK
ncbi:MraY family glycosyltransferase [Candidatus Auribacterota bacterium]